MNSSENNEANPHLVEILSEQNPQLTPQGLSEIFPSYKDFDLEKETDLWTTKPINAVLNLQKNKQEKIIFLLSGVAASGKDAIRERITNLSPQLIYKPVTATSRSPREGEKDGVDYFFYDTHQDFLEDVEDDQFIEYINQGDSKNPRYYGLPKKSLNQALNRPAPVICSQVEIESGWPAVSRYAQRHPAKPFVFKVFVLPKISFNEYTQNWLPNRRNNVDTRIYKAAKEISLAASQSHFILNNDLNQGKHILDSYSQSILNQIKPLLKKS